MRAGSFRRSAVDVGIEDAQLAPRLLEQAVDRRVEAVGGVEALVDRFVHQLFSRRSQPARRHSRINFDCDGKALCRDAAPVGELAHAAPGRAPAARTIRR